MVENNQLHYVRVLKINKNKYPKDDYQEFRSFLKEVIKADIAQVVLIKRKT